MKHDRRTAVFYMILSSASFALMGGCVKLAGDVPLFMKVFVRNLVIMVIIFISAGKAGRRNIRGERRNLPALLARAFFGLTAVVFYFYSIRYLPLSDSAMLNRISPFFVTVFAVFFLKEKASALQWPLLAAAFAGAVMIIKPGFDLSLMPAVAGFFSAVLAGAAYTLVRHLGVKGEKPFTIIFYFSVVSFAATLPAAVLTFRMPTLFQALLLGLTGLFAAGGQYYLTAAYSKAPANEISIYNYMNVLFAAIIGFFLWGEVPDMMSAAGALLIVLSAYMMFRTTALKRGVR